MKANSALDMPHYRGLICDLSGKNPKGTLFKLLRVESTYPALKVFADPGKAAHHTMEPSDGTRVKLSRTTAVE